MVFCPYENRNVDNIPDDTILPNLILTPQFGRRPLSESNSALFIDAPTGKQLTFDQVKERTDSLALGIRGELAIDAGWTGVIGLFAPNSVCINLLKRLMAVGKHTLGVLGNS